MHDFIQLIACRYSFEGIIETGFSALITPALWLPFTVCESRHNKEKVIELRGLAWTYSGWIIGLRVGPGPAKSWGVYPMPQGSDPRLQELNFFFSFE